MWLIYFAQFFKLLTVGEYPGVSPSCTVRSSKSPLSLCVFKLCQLAPFTAAAACASTSSTWGVLWECGHAELNSGADTPLQSLLFLLCLLQKKCERYWAQEQEPLQIGLFCITLTRETRLNADTMLRTLQVTFQKESRPVYQLQYMSWPDKGVPGNPDHVLAMVEAARRLQGSGLSPLCVHCSAGCGRTGVLCTVDYVRQLLLTQMIPPNFSLFDVVLEMRKQRPAAVQTEEQYKFLYHTVAQMFFSALRNSSPHYQNLKENRAPLFDDALSLRSSQTLPATPRLPGGVLRSISVPGPPALAMADTYAVVQKRGALAGPGPGSGARGTEEAPLYSQVAPRARRPQAPAEDARGAPPSRAPADRSAAAPGAYEDVADGAQTGGLGFNLRIGRPKGPRDPPVEWTRV
uniref:protein-tyrosine-phosphatase n=1 Tax=Equus caballus TaxID=9796 RepID=A0A9L0RF66_HORSE